MEFLKHLVQPDILIIGGSNLLLVAVTWILIKLTRVEINHHDEVKDAESHRHEEAIVSDITGNEQELAKFVVALLHEEHQHEQAKGQPAVNTTTPGPVTEAAEDPIFWDAVKRYENETPAQRQAEDAHTAVTGG